MVGYASCPYDFGINAHIDTCSILRKFCVRHRRTDCLVVRDGSVARSCGVAVVMTARCADPLGLLSAPGVSGRAGSAGFARAPHWDSTFKMYAFIPGAPPGQGGPPIVDVDRYAALAGSFPTASTLPARLPRSPGVIYRTVHAPRAGSSPAEFSVALAALPTPDSASGSRRSTHWMLYRGQHLDLKPNVGSRGLLYLRRDQQRPATRICTTRRRAWSSTTTRTVLGDFTTTSRSEIFDQIRRLLTLTATEQHYPAGHCVWTKLDCDTCAGDDESVDTIGMGLGRAAFPSACARLVPGDHTVHY